jgi:hypothetical protein
VRQRPRAIVSSFLANSSFACLDISSTISNTDGKFKGATTTIYGILLFAPQNADCVGIFDAERGEFACVDISSIISTNEKFGGAAVVSSGLVIYAPRGADCVGSFSIADCSATSFGCESSFYRTNCGFSTGGLFTLDAAANRGECYPCTNAGADQYYTDQGGLTNACPTQSCSDLPACAAGTQRVSCNGPSSGYCAACDLESLPAGSYFNASASDACAAAACTALPSCAIGQYRSGCGAFSEGTCLPCTLVQPHSSSHFLSPAAMLWTRVSYPLTAAGTRPVLCRRRWAHGLVHHGHVHRREHLQDGRVSRGVRCGGARLLHTMHCQERR